MKWRATLLALLVSLALPMGSLRADSLLQNHCVTDALTACLSTMVTTEWDAAAGVTRAKIYVRNVDDAFDYGYRISGIGLVAPELTDPIVGDIYETDDAIAHSDLTQDPPDPASYWNTTIKGGGNDELYFDLATQTPKGGIQGCNNSGAANDIYFETCVSGASGGWVVFEFTTTNQWSAQDAELAFKIVSNSENDESYNCPSDSMECTTTTVPEPISMILMGTGLAGLGAVRHRRRKEGEFGE